MNTAELGTETLVKLFKVLSKSDVLEVFLLAGEGIENSTYAIEELNITPKKYYARLGDLIDLGFIRKTGGIYKQTLLGNIIFDRFLPAIQRTYEAKDRLDALTRFEGTEMENGIRKLVEDKLGIPNFGEFTRVRMINDLESLVADTIDICDEAEESIILASNYFDVRVMEATFRSMDRGVANRIIGGKKGLSSRLQQLKLIFSTTIMKRIIKLTSMDIKEFVRFSDLPYSLCVVDGHLNLIIIPNIANENIIVAFLIDDKDLGEKLTESFEEFWKIGDYHPAFKFLDSLKP